MSKVKSEMILPNFWDYFAWTNFNFTKRFFYVKGRLLIVNVVDYCKKKHINNIYLGVFVHVDSKEVIPCNYAVIDLWPSLTKPIRSTGSLCNFMTKFKVNERTTRRESNLLIKVKLVQLNSPAQENPRIFFSEKDELVTAKTEKRNRKVI